MNIILLSGGSGTRLWPMSNDARSKQFLRLLNVDSTDQRESMIQRVMRQLNEAGIEADITVATSESQYDSVIAQLGNAVDIVTEPCRRDTFPAICLACEYISKEKGCPDDDIVVVMPCDVYANLGYFECIKRMAQGILNNEADMIVMGIVPTYPSAKYGYVIPEEVILEEDVSKQRVVKVLRFTEKPDVQSAKILIAQNALWNGGVFAFRLGYMTTISRMYVQAPTFSQIKAKYCSFPKISFDYEVAEKKENMGVIKYCGEWKDLGTWNTLTEELNNHEYGNVLTDETGENTHIFNELNIPLLCLGTKNLVIAASPDGIMVSEKSKSENIKEYASFLKRRPMYEERRWGTYKVIDTAEFSDGYTVLIKQLNLNPGCSISYQCHRYRDEVWIFIDGKGEIIINGLRRTIGRGETVIITQGTRHALRATTSLTVIEIQSGLNLIEDDIERFNYEWETTNL